MSTSAIIIANQWLSEVKQDLRDNYNRLGLKASGQWGETLEEFIRETPKGLTMGILAEKYSGALENGRKPNTKKSPKEMKAWVGWAGSTFLDDWVKDKGLNLNPYAVAWKIAREGWKVPNRFNAGGLVSDVVTKNKVEELNRSVSLFYIDLFRSTIIQELK